MVWMKTVATVFPVLAGLVSPAGAQERQCGWYVILGCSPDAYGAEKTLESVRGVVLPGSAGAHVVETDAYPDFNPGLFCVVDGPFESQAQGENVHWPDMVPGAYVKRGC